jgi:DNA-binding NtrC family response regulator/tetratricopeptide (TPR) repeat protein
MEIPADHSGNGSHRRASSYTRLISSARAALESCQHEEALTLCEAALKAGRLRAEQEALARCLMAEACDNLARFTDAVHTLSLYEQDDARRRLTRATQAQVCLWLGSAFGGTTEIPKAISFARQALALAEELSDPVAIAKCHLLLGTLYRRLGEVWFARDHLMRVTTDAPRHGDQLLLAQAYNGLGIVSALEGEWDKACEEFKHGYEALADADAPLLGGSLDVNLAAVATLQGRMRESLTLLERAVPQLERARHPRLVVNARSNLGHSLLRLGEISRAEAALTQSLAEAQSCEALLIAASTLETLGELRSIQGEFSAAEELFGQSLATLRSIRAGFNEAMALLTHGRCQLLAGRIAQAAVSFRSSFTICERIGDPRGQAAAQLGLIETHLATGATDAAQILFAEASPATEQLGNLPLIGQLREVSGLLALALGHQSEAIRCFNQAISVQEVLEDPYRCAVALQRLGEACARYGDTTRAREALNRARQTFLKLNAQPMLAQTEASLRQLSPANETESARRADATDPVTVITRLLEAGFSRDLLLHELTRVLHDEFGVTPVIVIRLTPGEAAEPLCYRGCDEREARSLSQHVAVPGGAVPHGAIHRLRAADDGALWLYLGKHREGLPDALVTLLLKQLRLGLERCAGQPRNTKPFVPESPSQGVHHFSLPGLIYCSEAMRKVVGQIHSLRSSNITVLITGETGTGKELVARAIHAFSSRAGHPFVPFNCAAAPRELLESQLFGHRRGAFTGATADFPGVIGAAEKGTLFLDEIGELAREMQPKLLRFLQSGEIHRLGEAAPRHADVRVIAATNRDLEEMVAGGEFRADLYYRLNVIQLHLPPLRERREEIALLAEHFLARYSEAAEKRGLALSPAVLNLLRQYNWPGNARQLENEMQRLVALAPAQAKVTPELLSPHISRHSQLRLISPAPEGARRTLAEAVSETEKQMIVEALARHQGNISKVAQELKVSRLGLRNMMRRHHILARQGSTSGKPIASNGN